MGPDPVQTPDEIPSMMTWKSTDCQPWLGWLQVQLESRAVWTKPTIKLIVKNLCLAVLARLVSIGTRLPSKGDRGL